MMFKVETSRITITDVMFRNKLVSTCNTHCSFTQRDLVALDRGVVHELISWSTLCVAGDALIVVIYLAIIHRVVSEAAMEMESVRHEMVTLLARPAQLTGMHTSDLATGCFLFQAA